MNQNLPPPPFMIFCSKLEVSQCHSNEGCDDEKYNKNYKENAIDCINSVAPDTDKYVVELNIDCTERQKTSHGHLWDSASIPRQWWNLSRILGSAAWSLELCFAVFSCNSTQDKQRRCYKGPDQNNYNNGAKRKCSCSIISNGNSVQEAECQEQGPTK